MLVGGISSERLILSSVQCDDDFITRGEGGDMAYNLEKLVNEIVREFFLKFIHIYFNDDDSKRNLIPPDLLFLCDNSRW